MIDHCQKDDHLLISTWQVTLKNMSHLVQVQVKVETTVTDSRRGKKCQGVESENQCVTVCHSSVKVAEGDLKDLIHGIRAVQKETNDAITQLIIKEKGQNQLEVEVGEDDDEEEEEGGEEPPGSKRQRC